MLEDAALAMVLGESAVGKSRVSGLTWGLPKGIFPKGNLNHSKILLS